MRLATLNLDGEETAAVRVEDGYVPIRTANARFGTDWPEALFSLIESGRLEAMRQWHDEGGAKEMQGRLSGGRASLARVGPDLPGRRRPGLDV